MLPKLDEAMQLMADHFFREEYTSRGRSLLLIASNPRTTDHMLEAIEELLWRGPVVTGDDPNPVPLLKRAEQVKRKGLRI